MDQLHERLERLEQRTHTVERQLRWWRGLACGLVVLAGLTWALPAGIAQEETKGKGPKGLAQRVEALEKLLKHFSREGKEIFITGANLHIVNGLGSTDCTDDQFEPIPDCPNSLGNLIVGYNEPREPDFGENIHTGSHNVVVGRGHNFSRFGGLVGGFTNTISGDFAVVTGGELNTASGDRAVVSGGASNTANGDRAVVSGGDVNTASGWFAVVSGGYNNTASNTESSVGGGESNTASGARSAVSGGFNNTASGAVWAVVSGGGFNTASGTEGSMVSGGFNNTASGNYATVSGGGDFNPEGGNTASGRFAVVSGGSGNVASGEASSVSGGQNITQETEFGWSAGSEADEVVEGNVRSP